MPPQEFEFAAVSWSSIVYPFAVYVMTFAGQITIPTVVIVSGNAVRA
jgi:hypothetical protein